MGIAHDDETVFNESCGHSWKLTGYGTSFIEVPFVLEKGVYALMINQATEMIPFHAKVTIACERQAGSGWVPA